MIARAERDPDAGEPVIRAHLAAILEWGQQDGAAAARLRAIQQPVLVVNGSDDIMIPTANSFTLWQQLPNAQLILYPDSGHASLFQYPELFVDHATRFLERE